MDIKWRRYSHSSITKVVAYFIIMGCLIGIMISLINVLLDNDGRFNIVFEDNYFTSSEHLAERRSVLDTLARLVGEFKNEEYIRQGGTIKDSDWKHQKELLFYDDFRHNSASYRPDASYTENYAVFQVDYADKIEKLKNDMIKGQLRSYNALRHNLTTYQGVIYYASDGENTFTNTTRTSKDHFTSYPSFIIRDQYERRVWPDGISVQLYWLRSGIYEVDHNLSDIYVAFTDSFLAPKITEWENNKAMATAALYRIAGFAVALVIALYYLILVIGRTSFGGEKVHMSALDRLYTDVNVALCLVLVVAWFGSGQWLYHCDFAPFFVLYHYDFAPFFVPLTVIVAGAILILILSLVRHLKNQTLLKHSLLYNAFYKLFAFLKAVYVSGSVGVKVMLIVIGYPIIVVLSLVFFPFVIGVAAWFALKRVKEFNAIKTGVAKIKEGDVQHKVDVPGDGEFAQLADSVNSIADGLRTAVDRELKSERLKTELITNVSHDIRTPLTSIITYIDLLKGEQGPERRQQYIAVLEQKSQRLKSLIDDLFEASKASSGNIPVTLERIDFTSLITQGLGELDDKVEASDLTFRINQPAGKVYVMADGKLLWRAIENLLTNTLKYALEGSRVYIDIQTIADSVKLEIKSISATELNISADELMERFKRGDEARSTQGSGLGLSIAKSLIELQGGKFTIEIDGDLFKAIIIMSRHSSTAQSA